MLSNDKSATKRGAQSMSSLTFFSSKETLVISFLLLISFTRSSSAVALNRFPLVLEDNCSNNWKSAIVLDVSTEMLFTLNPPDLVNSVVPLKALAVYEYAPGGSNPAFN